MNDKINMTSLSIALISIGIIIILAGIILHFGEKMFNLGKLPGDIIYKTKNTIIYFPFATSIIISIILTITLIIMSLLIK